MSDIRSKIVRVEPFTVGSYVHAIKRGARDMPIITEEADRWRFLRLLFYMNDGFVDEKWESNTFSKGIFFRPSEWPERTKLVEVVCYTLLPNHFHLLLREIREGGLSLFMKKLCESMSRHFNEKYHGRGSIFQGSYKGRTINSDVYLRYVMSYIMVKNSFELYPEGGLAGAIKNFEWAYDWAKQYSFCSLGDYENGRKSPIVTKESFNDIFTEAEFKNFSRDVILSGKWLEGTVFE